MQTFRSAEIFIRDTLAAFLRETDAGYLFYYDKAYLATANPCPVSLTLPLKEEPFESKTLFAFFDGLIPEGWLLDIVVHNWKLDKNDRFGILLAACKDCIGCVSVKETAQ